VVLMGVNLRPLFASLPPLLDDVRADLGLSAAAAGLLTTGPVLCLGALAPLGPRLVRRMPVERLLVGCGLVTALGLGLRGAGGTLGLFAGTLAAGAGVACAQVVLTALARARHPERAGLLTGLVSMALVLGAAAAAFAAVPLERAFAGSWRAALAVWALPALAATVAWLPAARRARGGLPAREGHPLWRSPLAWSISLFFGAQSMGFYATLAWVPSILETSGVSKGRAGALLGVSTLIQFGPAFAVPALAARTRGQLPWLLLVVALTLAGVLGLLAAPHAALVWMVVLGLGQGAALGLALVLPVLRGRDAEAVASLTAMAMGLGYTVAAAGPWLLGAVRDASGGWTAPLVVLAAVTVLELPAGMPAVRDRRL
jgi:MFS transporter, CP family, cyanate transporter